MNSEKTIPKTPADYTVVSYENYQQFISDFIDAKRTQNPRFTVRQFCLRMGIKTENYLLRIIRGERKLGPATSERLIKTIPLMGRDAEYFRLLVQRENSAAAEERKTLSKQLELIRQQSELKTKEAHEDLFKSWIHATIRELGKIPNLPLSSDRILSVLTFPTDRISILNSLEFLKKNNLLGGKESLTHPAQMDIKILRDFHKQHLDLAKQAIDLPPELRTVCGTTISIPQAKAEEFQRKVLEFMQNLQNEMNVSDRPDSVYRVQAQVFPLARLQKYGVSNEIPKIPDGS